MKKLIFIICTLFCAAMFAQDVTTDSIQLEEVVIQAYRANKHTPITFKNIFKKDIDKVNVGQDPSEIFSYTPSMNTHTDAGNYQGYSYFRLRGIDQTRINMTLDGIPLNEPEDQGVYFSNYPDFLNSANSIQIQRGVGTTTNGVASYGGSINFESPNLMLDSGTELGVNYGSYNTYRAYIEHNNIIGKNKAIYIRATNQGSDGYKNHSSNKSNSAFISAGIFKDKQSFKFIGFIGNQKNGQAWRGVPINIINENPQTNGNSNEHDNFIQSLVSIQHYLSISSDLLLNTTIYYNFLQGNYDFDLNNFLGLPPNKEIYNYNLRHNFTGIFSDINWNKDNLKVSSGLHVNKFSRRHIGSELTIGKLYENTGYKNEFSYFAKAEYRINKTNFFTDIQYRYTDFDYVGSIKFNKIDWNFINPKVGISHSITDNISGYYSFGRTGREPTRNDLFNGEDDLPADANGDPIYVNVSPEFVSDHEVGIKITQESWYLHTNIYYMVFEDEIVLNGQYGPTGLPLHSNVTKSSRSGIEIDMNVPILNNIYYENNMNISYNRISEDNIDFQPVLTPNFILNQKLGYKSDNFGIGITSKYQGQSFVDLSNTNSLPSFLLFNISSSYKYKHVTLQATINNITNENILSSGYINIDGTPLYFIQAPTNFNIGIKWDI